MGEGNAPRASDTQLLASSPTIVESLKSSATAAEPMVTANQGQGTTGAGVASAGTLLWDGVLYQRVSNLAPIDPSGGGPITTILAASPVLWDNDSGVLRRQAVARGIADASSLASTPGAAVMLWNETAWDRSRNNSAAYISGTVQRFNQAVAEPGEWTVVHTPAAGVKATATKAAGAAGVRHVCRSISFSLVGVAAVTAIQVNLRDGATGAGTILWSMTVAVGAGQILPIVLPGLNIYGTAETAMTLEFSAAGGAGDFESVTMTGYSTL